MYVCIYLLCSAVVILRDGRSCECAHSGRDGNGRRRCASESVRCAERWIGGHKIRRSVARRYAEGWVWYSHRHGSSPVGVEVTPRAFGGRGGVVRERSPSSASSLASVGGRRLENETCGPRRARSDSIAGRNALY